MTNVLKSPYNLVNKYSLSKTLSISDKKLLCVTDVSNKPGKSSLTNVTLNRHLTPYAGQDDDFEKSKFHKYHCPLKQHDIINSSL